MKDNMWKKFIASDLSGKVITTFKDIFLGIYFLKISQGNIFNVSIYSERINIIYCFIVFLFLLLFIFWPEKISI